MSFNEQIMTEMAFRADEIRSLLRRCGPTEVRRKSTTSRRMARNGEKSIADVVSILQNFIVPKQLALVLLRRNGCGCGVLNDITIAIDIQHISTHSF